jgi:hypothetical protein
MPSGKRKAGSEELRSSSTKRIKAATAGKRGGARATAPSAQRLAAAIRGAATGGSKRHSSRLQTRQSLLEVHADGDYDAPRSVAGRISVLDDLLCMRPTRLSAHHAKAGSSAVHLSPRAECPAMLTGSRRRTAAG